MNTPPSVQDHYITSRSVCQVVIAKKRTVGARKKMQLVVAQPTAHGRLKVVVFCFWAPAGSRAVQLQNEVFCAIFRVFFLLSPIAQFAKGYAKDAFCIIAFFTQHQGIDSERGSVPLPVPPQVCGVSTPPSFLLSVRSL